MAQELNVGDQVRPADSSVDHIGVIVGIRDSDYVIVHWHGSMRSTHHRSSLEHLNNAPARAVNS